MGVLTPLYGFHKPTVGPTSRVFYPNYLSLFY
jgi:hypothetical protein